MSSLRLTLLLFLVNKSISAPQSLPHFIKVCHQSDPKLSDCIKESVELLKPKLATGIPELNIPSCEPMLIKNVTIEQGTGPVAVNSIYKNIQISGPSRFTLKKVKIDLKKDRIRFQLFVPKLSMVADYKMSGRILALPVVGEGKSYGNYSNINVTVTIQGKRNKLNGQNYFSIKDFYVDFHIAEAKIRFDNLFNGDPTMGQVMNEFINQNWNSVADEIKPVLEDTIAEIFKDFSNNIFQKYPMDVLMPP